MARRSPHHAHLCRECAEICAQCAEDCDRLGQHEEMRRCAEAFGSQAIVVAIDARKKEAGEGWEVFTHGGRRGTGIDAIGWCRDVAARGAGEILLTSMDRDGTGKGFDLDLLRAATGAVRVPVIASGGVGTLQHFVEGAEAGATGLLAASVFHFGTFTIDQVKDALEAAGQPVRHTRQAA